MRLCINIDHVATVRQARRTDEPDPVRAAVLVEMAGADGITIHLREDRRHIQDRDVDLLLSTARTPVNLEISASPQMVALAARWRPAQVTLVPEKREEITTEGGLALGDAGVREAVERAVDTLVESGVRTSLFIDPEPETIRVSSEIGVDAIELHTGEFANAGAARRAEQVARIRRASVLGRSLRLAVHAGHGLTYENIRSIASIPEIEEVNIGHSVVSRAVFVGMERAVREMAALIRQARVG